MQATVARVGGGRGVGALPGTGIYIYIYISTNGVEFMGDP